MHYFYLVNKWNKIKNNLKDKYIFLFLDYDGTLTSISETPEKATIPVKAKMLLERLSKNPKFKIAIISGRVLRDVKNKVGLKNIIYAGNHGLELEGPKIRFKAPIPEGYKSILNQIKNRLKKKLSQVKGAFVEDKCFSLSLHYRLVDKKDIPKVKIIFHEIVILFKIQNKIRTKSGKMVFEIRPPINWDKGKAVLWLLARQCFSLRNKKQKIFPIYIGDDVTDEDAFKVLRNKGLTIFVGRPKTSYAEYFLKDTKEVIRFLKNLNSLNQKR